MPKPVSSDSAGGNTDRVVIVDSESIESSNPNYRLPLYPMDRGGFGKVWKAKVSDCDEIVAIKKVLLPKDATSITDLQRREIEIIKNVSHPFVTRCIEVYIDNNYLCFVMVWCENLSLRHRLRRCSSDNVSFQPQIPNALAQICLGLSDLHTRNIIHRDLKPANILISGANDYKLCDFGLSKILPANESVTFTYAGTKAYMSPEMISSDKPEHRKHTDMWSLGVVLYEMATSRHPFMDGHEQVLENHIENARYPPLNIPNIPVVQQLVEQMLHIDPQDRPTVDMVLDEPYLNAALQLVYRRYPHLNGPNRKNAVQDTYIPVPDGGYLREDENAPWLSLRPLELMPNEVWFPTVDWSQQVSSGDHQWSYNDWAATQWRDMVLGTMREHRVLHLPPVHLPSTEHFHGSLLGVGVLRRFTHDRASRDVRVVAYFLPPPHNPVSPLAVKFNFSMELITRRRNSGELKYNRRTVHCVNIHPMPVHSNTNPAILVTLDSFEWDQIDYDQLPTISLAVQPFSQLTDYNPNHDAPVFYVPATDKSYFPVNPNAPWLSLRPMELSCTVDWSRQVICHDEEWPYRDWAATQWRDMVLGVMNERRVLHLPPVHLPSNHYFGGYILCVELLRRFSRGRASRDLRVMAYFLPLACDVTVSSLPTLKFNCHVVIDTRNRSTGELRRKSKSMDRLLLNTDHTTTNNAALLVTIEPFGWDEIDCDQLPVMSLAMQPCYDS